jgi:poly-gamma-glutamate system protein
MGSLSAKRTAANPNFAGLMVHWLLESGVRAHDNVWVSFSGSFPTLNIATLSAIRVLELNPIIISSIGASMYGANDPRMTWLDMERILREHGVLKFKSIAASLGGVMDTKGGLDGTGIQFGIQNIRKNEVPYLHIEGFRNLAADIKEWLRIYEYESIGRKPSVFINVGGVLPSLGNIPEVYALGVGLITKVPKSNHPERGIIFRMIESEVPVIHMLDIKKLAREYGLPVDPTPMPELPDGIVMRPHRYLKPLAWAGLAVLIAGAWMAARRKKKVNMISSAPC